MRGVESSLSFFSDRKNEQDFRKDNMKAAIYLGQENVEVRELPDPVCGDNDVVIQNIYSSICGTDVTVYTKGPNTGHRINVGGEFGHETVSHIVEVGKKVTEFKVGERVYPYSRYAKNDTGRAGTIGVYFPEDVRDVMEIMASGKWDLESIITQEFPLERISEAIRTAADPEKAFNVTIRF